MTSLSKAVGSPLLSLIASYVLFYPWYHSCIVHIRINVPSDLVRTPLCWPLNALVSLEALPNLIVFISNFPLLDFLCARTVSTLSNPELLPSRQTDPGPEHRLWHHGICRYHDYWTDIILSSSWYSGLSPYVDSGSYTSLFYTGAIVLGLATSCIFEALVQSTLCIMMA